MTIQKSDYKEIKTRYDGTCSQCKRQLRIGWTIYFYNDSGVKSILCKPCYEKMANDNPELEVFDGAAADQAVKVDVAEEILIAIGEMAGTDNLIRQVVLDLTETVKGLQASLDVNTVRIEQIFLAVQKKPQQAKPG